MTQGTSDRQWMNQEKGLPGNVAGTETVLPLYGGEFWSVGPEAENFLIQTADAPNRSLALLLKISFHLN